MKKLIKYRICAMLILIVLMFSWVPVHAKINEQPIDVDGDGSEENPYVIDVGAVGGKIVIKPEEVPFNFVVKGTGGFGGLFAVEYDISSGLVSFTLTETIDTMLGDDRTNATVAKEKGAITTQFGITYRETTETLSPKYDIGQIYRYWKRYDYGNKCDFVKNTPTTITNAYAQVALGAYFAKDDLYFFANDPQLFSFDVSKYKNSENKNDKYKLIKEIDSDLGTSYLSDIVKMYEVTNYEFDGIDFRNKALKFYKTDENGQKNVYSAILVCIDYIQKDAAYNVTKKDFFANTSYVNGVYQIKPVTLMYKFNGKSATATDSDKAGWLEDIITRIFILLGDGVLLKMLQGIFPKDLTINSLIFNQFDDTKLNFYSSNPSELCKGLAEVVNGWYKVFQELAYLLYVVILVYIAIMIMVTAGTPEQDKNKKNLGNWFAGLAIMVIVPTFAIPSLIKLNDAFVKFMYNRNGTEIKTYYNVDFPEGEEVILGGDSATVSIETLMEARKTKVEEMEEFEEGKGKKLKEIESIIDGLEIEKSFVRDYVKEWFVIDKYENYKNEREKGRSPENAMTYILSVAHSNFVQAISRMPGFTRDDYNQVAIKIWNPHEDKYYEDMNKKNESRGYEKGYEKKGDGYYYETLTGRIAVNPDDPSNIMREIYKTFEEIYTKEQTINAIDQLIESKNTDLMTVMRTYAGKTGRIIFAVVWYALLFQFIALIFIYYKRIFVIAILIAIFPLIMIFYCIDKMADGSAQTLSMWFKELIADIFIQSVHCVIYTVLVQMGLEVYHNNPNNWFLFLAAMMLLVPAERMMKEIFGLNSSTLGQLGGMGMKLAAGVGTAVMLAKMGGRKIANKIGGKKNKAAIDMANKSFAKLQGKQNKADLKSERRDNRQKIADMKNAQRVASGKKGVGMAIRNGMYRAGTAVRSAREKMHEMGTARREKQASRIPKKAKAQARKESAKQALKVAGGIAYGLYSAANGEGMTGLYAGVQMAEKATRDKTVSGKEAVLKDELETAYKRKAAKRSKP